MTSSAHPSSEWKNLFGVCAAIGEDLGFNPLWLRIAFAVPLIWNPTLVLAAYAAAALVVLVSRIAFPVRRRGGSAEPLPFTRAEASADMQPLARAA